MSAFHKSADMYVVAPRLPLLPTRFVDNTMPHRDWSKFDEPTWIRKQRALNGERTQQRRRA